MKEFLSPEGTYKAVVFQRDCGATTGFSTQISVLKMNKKVPNKSGNLFIADTNYGDAPAASWGGPQVEVAWKNNNSLIIRHHLKTKIFKQVKKYMELILNI